MRPFLLVNSSDICTIKGIKLSFFLCYAKDLNIRSTWQTDCVSRKLRPASVQAARAFSRMIRIADSLSRGNATLGQQISSSLFVLILPSWFFSVPLNHLLPAERKGRGISCIHLHSASVSSFSNTSHMLLTICLKSFCLNLLLSHSFCGFRLCPPDFNSLGASNKYQQHLTPPLGTLSNYRCHNFSMLWFFFSGKYLHGSVNLLLNIRFGHSFLCPPLNIQ